MILSDKPVNRWKRKSWEDLKSQPTRYKAYRLKMSLRTMKVRNSMSLGEIYKWLKRPKQGKKAMIPYFPSGVCDDDWYDDRLAMTLHNKQTALEVPPTHVGAFAPPPPPLYIEPLHKFFSFINPKSSFRIVRNKLLNSSLGYGRGVLKWG